MRNEKDKDPWTNLRVRRSTVRILDRLGVLMAKERRMLKPLSQQEAAHQAILEAMDHRPRPSRGQAGQKA